VNLDSDGAVRDLIHGIVAGITDGADIILDLSGCTGNALGSVFFIPAEEKERITGITLPASITTIGSSAFSDFTRLTSVSAPAATGISGSAFSGCTALAAVSFPAATTIGDFTFSGCTSLATVSLDAAETIGRYAFQGCTSLDTVSLPAATYIGVSAFSGCTALDTVSLDAAETIDLRVFYGCTALAAVSLEAAETFSIYVFEGCTSLADLTLGNTPPTFSSTEASGIFKDTVGGDVDTIIIHVPDTSAYISAIWPGVGTPTTNYNSIYGANSKKVLITN
jgi:hypothetical protein